MTTNFDVICLTETHIDSTIPSSSFIHDLDKTVFRCDRDIHGGGVLIAINKHLNPS
jgi:hypothetical protein